VNFRSDIEGRLVSGLSEADAFTQTCKSAIESLRQEIEELRKHREWLNAADVTSLTVGYEGHCSVL
jgi:hypothetical protein